MDIPVSPSQDVGIRVSNVNGQLISLDDVNKVWTVRVRLQLEYPDFNKDGNGDIVDPKVNVRMVRRPQQMLEANVQVDRADIAAQAGLGAPEDVPNMPAGDMEAAIIAVALGRTSATFGVTLA